MRGDEERQEAVFVFDSLEDRVPAGHPLRRIRRLVDTALRDLDPVFEDLYAIPSERKLCELRGTFIPVPAADQDICTPQVDGVPVASFVK